MAPCCYVLAARAMGMALTRSEVPHSLHIKLTSLVDVQIQVRKHKKEESLYNLLLSQPIIEQSLWVLGNYGAFLCSMAPRNSSVYNFPFAMEFLLIVWYDVNYQPR
jgi:hypothetical protein